MIEMIFDGFYWASNEVTKFRFQHWAICFVALLALGFVCMKGLGVRGAR